MGRAEVHRLVTTSSTHTQNDSFSHREASAHLFNQVRHTPMVSSDRLESTNYVDVPGEFKVLCPFLNFLYSQECYLRFSSQLYTLENLDV